MLNSKVRNWMFSVSFLMPVYLLCVLWTKYIKWMYTLKLMSIWHSILAYFISKTTWWLWDLRFSWWWRLSSPWRFKQQGPLKWWCPTSLHIVTEQKIMTWILDGFQLNLILRGLQ
jgi:hypothetical protein